MERTIVINQYLITLTVIREADYCDKCQKEGQMRLLIKRNDQQTHWCQACSLNLLDQLSNYQFTSKEVIIKELRTELTKQLWVDYYLTKKPYCVPCLSLGISKKEYRFCETSCLVKSWIQYHGQHYLKNHG